MYLQWTAKIFLTRGKEIPASDVGTEVSNEHERGEVKDFEKGKMGDDLVGAVRWSFLQLLRCLWYSEAARRCSAVKCGPVPTESL